MLSLNGDAVSTRKSLLAMNIECLPKATVPLVPGYANAFALTDDVHEAYLPAVPLNVAFQNTSVPRKSAKRQSANVLRGELVGTLQVKDIHGSLRAVLPKRPSW
jgi:hypothetical protein